MSDTYNLDREANEAANVDATGKKWIIVVNRTNGLCHTRPQPDREDAVIPKNMEGQWTKPSLLMTQIEKYVKETWDKAEKVVNEARRKAEAASEAAKRAAAMEQEKINAEKAKVTAEESKAASVVHQTSEDNAGSTEEKAKEKVTKKKTTTSK